MDVSFILALKILLSSKQKVNEGVGKGERIEREKGE